MKPGAGEKQDGMDRDATGATLAEATAVFGKLAGSDAGRTRDVLERRARLLAVPPRETALPAGLLTLVTFTLGGERYGVEEENVRGVARLQRLASVPGAPSAIAGIAVFLGDFLTVADLRIPLGISASSSRECNYLLILADGRGQLGIMVEEFNDMAMVGAGDVKSASSSEAGMEPGLVRGVTPDGIIVIDTAGLFAQPCVGSREAGVIPDRRSTSG